MARLLRFGIAAGTSIVIILLLTYGANSLHLWPGGPPSSLDYFVGGFVFFPIIVGLLAALWPTLRQGRPLLAAGATGAATGLAYGYCMPRVGLLLSFYELRYWRYLLPLSLGDIPGVVCAVVAGVCAMLLSVTTRSRFVIAIVGVLVVAGIFVPSPAFDLITQNQELTVAIVIPGAAGALSPPTLIANSQWVNEPSVIANIWSTPVDPAGITNHVLSLLRKEGLTGPFHVSDIYRGGHGKQGLAVIVFNQPVVNEVQLPQPRGGEVIYLQQPNGWKKIPSRHPTLGRALEIEPEDEDAFGRLTIWGAGGGSLGFAIVKTSEGVASHR